MRRSDECPQLRPVEVVPQKTPDGTITLRDPSGLAHGALSVSATVLFILAKMDGKTQIADIQAAYTRRFGRMLFSREIDALITSLEETLFLESNAVRQRVESLERQYRETKVRPMIVTDCWGDSPVDAVRETLQSPPALNLSRQHRLHVLEGWADEPTEAAAFSAADVVWLGYDGHWQSSGVLIQACQAGLPVLACDRGIIGWFTRKHRIGLAVPVQNPLCWPVWLSHHWLLAAASGALPPAQRGNHG